MDGSFLFDTHKTCRVELIQSRYGHRHNAEVGGDVTVLILDAISQLWDALSVATLRVTWWGQCAKTYFNQVMLW